MTSSFIIIDILLKFKVNTLQQKHAHTISENIQHNTNNM